MRDDIAPAMAQFRQPLFISGWLLLALTLSMVGFMRYGWTPRLWCLVPVLIVLAVIMLMDIRTKTIPDLITLPAIAYTLIVALSVGIGTLGLAMLGAIIAGGMILLLAIVSRGAFGGGDIKLMAILGAALGWKGAVAVLALSQLAAALIALVLIIFRRATRHDHLPVGAIISAFGTAMLLSLP